MRTESARSAVDLAQSAFEYRDFERVVNLLYPWLHPRRIIDPALAIQARQLLGVSLHVLGRIDDAKEEFAELLVLDPEYKLDPFLVPPPVVRTFKAVRESMKQTLERILRERGVRPAAPPSGRPVIEPIGVTPLTVSLLPLGIPQFAADEVGWGLLWAVLQVGFVTLNLVGFDQAGRNNGDTYTFWTGMQYAGLGGFFAAWTASGVQGYLQLKAARQRTLDEARGLEFGAASSLIEPGLPRDPNVVGSTPGVRLEWSF